MTSLSNHISPVHSGGTCCFLAPTRPLHSSSACSLTDNHMQARLPLLSMISQACAPLFAHMHMHLESCCSGTSVHTLQIAHYTKKQTYPCVHATHTALEPAGYMMGCVGRHSPSYNRRLRQTRALQASALHAALSWGIKGLNEGPQEQQQS